MKLKTLLLVAFVAIGTSLSHAQAIGWDNTRIFTAVPLCQGAALSATSASASPSLTDVCLVRSSAGVFKITTNDLSTAAPLTVSALTTSATSDGYFFVPASACSISQASGTETVASVLKIVGAIQAVQETTTTTTATDTVICAIPIPSRLTALKGVTINDVTLLYGNSTGAIGTCNAPTFASQTAPAAGTSEVAASATLVAAGGALTVTPVVGSCNTAAVTAGQVYSEKIALGTPVAVTTDLLNLYLNQSFIGPASATFTLNVAGVAVHYSAPTVL